VALRPCLGCGRLTAAARCPACQPPRLSTAERGYGSDHQAERDRWKPVIDAGQGWCAETVCLKPSRRIPPGTPWDLGHTPDRLAVIGPCHMECNRAEGARRGNRLRQRRPARWVTSRQW